MTSDPRQRAAIVTCAGGGIGPAVSRRLLRDGASVLLADLNQERLEDATAQLAALKMKGGGVVVKVSSVHAVETEASRRTSA